ncbi:MAG: trehalose-6-phosphate synthase, partial [Ktedonobacterales bacterium]
MIKDQGAIENRVFSFDTHSIHSIPIPTPRRSQHGDERRVIFVTNRGPIEHAFAEDGTPEARCGAGGVVSGLLCAARGRPVSWISVAMTDADRALARDGDAILAAPCAMEDLTARLVHIPATTYSRYYGSISNRLLWFAQHGLPHAHIIASPALRDHWERGYVAVNRALADAVLADIGDGGANASIMFHDYHLYLAPKMVRDRMPNVRMQHFVHIPWPAPDGWAHVPDDMMRAIYEGLAANDVIGLQTQRDVANFLAGARRYLPGAYVVRETGMVWWDGRQIAVRAYPIALTKETVEEAANTPAALEQVARIREQFHLDAGR